MRTLATLALSFALIGAVQAQDAMLASNDRAPGSPGTATPHPFEIPAPRPLPNATPSSPPLLDNSSGSRMNPRPATLPERDGELPLLEQQRQRESPSPAPRSEQRSE
ncbi:hypothetical protein ACX0MV_11670 [Pseudomonas borbori]